MHSTASACSRWCARHWAGRRKGHQATHRGVAERLIINVCQGPTVPEHYTRLRHWRRGLDHEVRGRQQQRQLARDTHLQTIAGRLNNRAAATHSPLASWLGPRLAAAGFLRRRRTGRRFCSLEDGCDVAAPSAVRIHAESASGAQRRIHIAASQSTVKGNLADGGHVHALDRIVSLRRSQRSCAGGVSARRNTGWVRWQTGSSEKHARSLTAEISGILSASAALRASSTVKLSRPHTDEDAGVESSASSLAVRAGAVASFLIDRSACIACLQHT